MRRGIAQILGVVVVLVVVGGIAAGIELNRSSNPSTPTPAPTPTVVPVSTRVVPPPSPHVKLTRGFTTFVNSLCSAIQHRNGAALETKLMYYQYNQQVYYGTFNLGPGNWALPTQLPSWIDKHGARCIRVAEPYKVHGVLLTKGWRQPGGWGLIDLDIPPSHTTWHINDFTFGSRAQVLGAFFANVPSSLPYRSKV